MYRFLLYTLLLLLTLYAAAHGGHDSDPETHDLRSKSLILVKFWCLILVFVGVSLGPYFLKWNDRLLVLGTQFAGGVFFGTSMMHFLSDLNETFGDLTSKVYPFAFMSSSFGGLLTTLATCVIVFMYGKKQGSDTNGYVELHGDINQGKDNHNGTTSQSSLVNHGTEDHFKKPPLRTANSFGDSNLMMVALCFHSVFEGIAIKVAETEADVWNAPLTISLHNIFKAVAIGISLFQMIPDHTSCAFAFAISSPIGVAIGIILDATTQGAVADWIYAISRV